MAAPNLPEPYRSPQYSAPPASPAGWGYPVPAAAPYGIDPMSGRPFSDKSKIVAGLLQLLPGFFLGLGGIGRLYAGQVTLGVLQIVGTLFGWVSFWCGFVLVLPFAVTIGMWAWFIVDGIVLMAGRPTDSQGRVLRS